MKTEQRMKGRFGRASFVHAEFISMRFRGRYLETIPTRVWSLGERAELEI